MSNFAVQDLVPQIPNGKDNSALLFWEIDKPWNYSKSLKETVHYLVINSVNSYATLMENCRIISGAKEKWKGLNISEDIVEKDGKWVHSKIDDWDRLKKILTGQLQYTDKLLEQMDAIWKGRTEEIGGLNYVFQRVTPVHLPDSITALYEIATITVSSKTEPLLDLIVEKIQNQSGISIRDIREIKSGKNGKKPANAEKKSISTDRTTTTLKLPKSVEELKELNKNWDKIYEHIQAINQLSKLELIIESTPTEKIDELTKKEKEAEKNKRVRHALDKFRAYVKNHVIREPKDLLKRKIEVHLENLELGGGPENYTNKEDVAKRKEKIKVRQRIKKENEKIDKWNNKIDALWKEITDLSLESQCQEIINDWKEEVKRKQERNRLLGAALKETVIASQSESVEASSETEAKSKWHQAITETA